jgi:putative glutamine amidotransferase
MSAKNGGKDKTRPQKEHGRIRNRHITDKEKEMRIALTLTKHDKTCSVNNQYVDYVLAAGYTPFLVRQGTSPEVVADTCDGLILKGGSDVEPMFYGMSNVSSIDPDPELDEFERGLLWAFVNLEKPVFGICRGFQLIFLELCRHLNDGGYGIRGLEFKQHIKGHSQSSNSVRRSVPFHFIHYKPKLHNWNDNQFINEIVKGKEEGMPWDSVNSLHHQGVEKVKTFAKIYNPEDSPIHILAWSNRVVEAFASRIYKILAVQWHPEELQDIQLLQGFFGAEEEMLVDILR